jgi:hypothetical protein
MISADPLPHIEQKSPWHRAVLGAALHTFIVYVLALRISPLLARAWCAWVLPALGLYGSVRPLEWHLQHLELITILPALIGGYVNLPRFIPTIVGGQIKQWKSSEGMRAWIVPTCVLLVEMTQHHAPSSVLYAGSRSVLRYFFEIQRHINPGFDPVRIARQIFVTGPFYAGVAYAAGALSKKHRLIQRLLTTANPEASVLVGKMLGDTTPGPPSSSRD